MILRILLLLPATTVAFVGGNAGNIGGKLACEVVLFSGHGCYSNDEFQVIKGSLGGKYEGTSGRDIGSVQITNSCTRVQLVDDDSGSFFEGDRQDCIFKGPRNGMDNPNVSGPCSYDKYRSDKWFFCIDLNSDLEDDILGVGVVGNGDAKPPGSMGRGMDLTEAIYPRILMLVGGLAMISFVVAGVVRVVSGKVSVEVAQKDSYMAV